MSITWRRKAGRLEGVLLALGFAIVLLPIYTADRWLGLSDGMHVGEPSSMTVRLPDPGVAPDETGASLVQQARVLVARGDELTPAEAPVVNAVLARRPTGGAAVLGLLATFALVGVLLTVYLRGSQRGRLLRVQLSVLGAMVALAAVVQVFLLVTPLSAFLVPTSALAILVAILVDRNAGLAAALGCAMVVATLTPFDAPLAIVLATQGMAGVLSITRPKRRRAFLLAGVVAGVAAMCAYVAMYYLYVGGLPFAELRAPLRSGFLAALGGGLLAGPTALGLRAVIERLVGEIPRAKLIEYADLENPLLKKIAAESPGTWQHSLAMANMAEMAASAIGANALLVRVGAYYHNLGKSTQPQYYIENLGPGQPSPHDQLPPEVSADAIFAHVTEGVRIGRAHGLPEAIIDFMHMHHGDGVLEYFWSKCREQGNPQHLGIEAFRYPGVKPQSKETAILTICDAVEASSRTLKLPDARAIEALVQRIVYGKLHLGQLDESGLTVTELKVLANTLVDILKHAHHVRIEYPWQREERELRAAAGGTTNEGAMATTQPTVAGTPEALGALAQTQPVAGASQIPTSAMSASAPPPAPPSAAAVSARQLDSTRRFLIERALDSADIPRPWGEEARVSHKPAAHADPAHVTPRPRTAPVAGEGVVVTPAVPAASAPPPKRRPS